VTSRLRLARPVNRFLAWVLLRVSPHPMGVPPCSFGHFGTGLSRASQKRRSDACLRPRDRRTHPRPERHVAGGRRTVILSVLRAGAHQGAGPPRHPQPAAGHIQLFLPSQGAFNFAQVHASAERPIVSARKEMGQPPARRPVPSWERPHSFPAGSSPHPSGPRRKPRRKEEGSSRPRREHLSEVESPS